MFIRLYPRIYIYSCVRLGILRYIYGDRNAYFSKSTGRHGYNRGNFENHRRGRVNRPSPLPLLDDPNSRDTGTEERIEKLDGNRHGIRARFAYENFYRFVRVVLEHGRLYRIGFSFTPANS